MSNTDQITVCPHLTYNREDEIMTYYQSLIVQNVQRT